MSPNVVSPAGLIHRRRDKGGRTVCGAVYLDLFATREYGTMWPTTDEPVTCRNCVRATPKLET